MSKFSNNTGAEHLIAGFKTMLADAEALLQATANQSGKELNEVRAKTENSIRAMKSHIDDAQVMLVNQAKASAVATDKYVHENPWKTVGMGVGLGLLVGLALERRWLLRHD